MKEQFVSFEIAKILKEKGFDEICMGVYVNEQLCPYGIPHEPRKFNTLVFTIVREEITSAPLWQQTLDLLRDVKGIFIDLTLHDRENTETWKYEISEYGYYNMLAQENVYKSYYNTRELAIKKALELI